MRRVPENCAYTSQHNSPDFAQKAGASAVAGLGIPNGGLQVVTPAKATYEKILEGLASSATSKYDFADQSLLGDMFYGRWVALPYIYNALKTLRWEGVHDAIWRDENVKNIHYILSPKPWDEWADRLRGSGNSSQNQDQTHAWWASFNEERLDEEQKRGLRDQF